MAVFKGFWIVQTFVSVFFAILFLQSGLDKVTDRKGNLEWLTGHFLKTFLKGMVPMMLTTVTIVELAAGTFSVIGVVEAVFFKTFCFAFAGTVFAALAFVMLFFGQRIAKDYAGAATIASYFIVAVVDLYFLA
ncbi:MAG: DoxX family protein [Bacteroidia bacterium]